MWDDPEDFKPERFLNDQGEIVNTDKTMPFGYGESCFHKFFYISMLASIIMLIELEFTTL